MCQLADLWTNIIGTCNFLLRNGKQKHAERFAERFAKRFAKLDTDRSFQNQLACARFQGFFSEEVHALSKDVTVYSLTPWDKWFSPYQPAKC